MLPWFHGSLSRPDAEKALTRTAAVSGSALFRESRNNAVLSVYLHGNFYSHHVLTRPAANAELRVDDHPVPGCFSATQLVALLRDASAIVTVPLVCMVPGPRNPLCPLWLLGAVPPAEAARGLRGAGEFRVCDGPAPGTFVLAVHTGAGGVVLKELDFAPTPAGCTLDGYPLQTPRPLTSVGMAVAHLQAARDPALPVLLLAADP